MALLLRHEDVCAAVGMEDAIVAMEEAFREEGEGAVLLPPRINMKAGKGWLRVGPVSLEKSGWMGFKAMNLAPGHGVRYQVHLYRADFGRTACNHGRAAPHNAAYRRNQRGRDQAPCTIGTGGGRTPRLRAGSARPARSDAGIGIVKSAKVFSPTPANRERLAEDMRREHDMNITSVASAREAVAGSDIVLAAVKSAETVLFGEWLTPGMHVNSVGTARRDQREIDPVTFQRSAVTVVDTREGVFGEAGDAVAAKDVVRPDQVYELAELVIGKAPSRSADDQITLFKSVGTGVQDIALAAKIYQRATERGLGLPLHGFPIVKKG